MDDVKLLMHRQRLTSKQKSFEDLVRENLNKQQIDALITAIREVLQDETAV